jgi:hypothetical protein
MLFFLGINEQYQMKSMKMNQSSNGFKYSNSVVEV